MQATGPAKAQISWWESQQLEKDKTKQNKKKEQRIPEMNRQYLLNILLQLIYHVNWKDGL